MKFKTSIDYRLCNYPLSLLLLSGSTALHAADDELFFEMPIVLSANRLEQSPSDAAVSISIINHSNTINRQVFKAQNLSLPDTEKLKQSLLQAEKEESGEQQ